MIGLPSTGKTTFLAALYHIVETRSVPGALDLASIPDKREYLNRIRRTWSNCSPQEHTRAGYRFDVTLSLREPESGAVADMVFPDLYGELFNQQYGDREWTQEYEGLVTSSAAALLFLHPEKIRPPATIRERNELERELAGLYQGSEAAAGGSQEASGLTDPGQARLHSEAPQSVPLSCPEWTPDLAPTQVELIELLQFVAMRRQCCSALPLAVVVSAWDLVPQPAPTPASWVAQQLPLLSQYLLSNPDVYRTAFYGVSAQGGDLETHSNQLQMVTEPADRIVVVNGGCAPHDLAAPIRWLMHNAVPSNGAR
jgi:hypothetical protein